MPNTLIDGYVHLPVLLEDVNEYGGNFGEDFAVICHEDRDLAEWVDLLKFF